MHFSQVLNPLVTFSTLVFFNYGQKMLRTILLRRHKTIRNITSVLAPSSNTYINVPFLTTVKRYISLQTRY